MNKIFIGATLLLVSAQSFSAGFEKSVLWSAKWASLAGNAAAGVSGADSVYYNPAGLAEGANNELSLNFSPTYSQFKGPIPVSNVQVTGKKNMSPVFGALFSHKFNEKLGVGAGYYVSGGTNAEYKSVDFSGVKAAFDQVKPDVIAKLAVTEFSLGAGYKLNENFNLGLAWRAVFIDAQFGSSKVTNVTALGGAAVLTSLQLKELKDKNYGGFKLGAQYTATDKVWGVGASFRNSIKIEAEGDVTATAESINAATGVPVTPTALSTSGKAKIKNKFPWSFHLDGYYQVVPVVKVLAGLTYTKYSQNQTLVIDGTAAGTEITDVNQKWKDQYNYRLASEITCMKNVPIFLGYVLTTQVTSSDYARATFASPGKGHTLTVGSGYVLENMQFLIGFEHSQAKGDATDTDNGVKGSYASNGNTVNTTFKFMF